MGWPGCRLIGKNLVKEFDLNIIKMDIIISILIIFGYNNIHNEI